MLVFGGYLIFNGISAIFTGETMTIIGAGVVSSHKLVIFHENQSRFIVEVIIRFVLGGGIIMAALTRKKNNK